MKGISAIIAVILLLVITIAMAGTAYMYFSRIMGAKTSKSIELLDASCSSGGKINVVIQNTGTTSIDESELKFLVDGTPITTFSCDPSPVGSENSTICNFSNSAWEGKIHDVRVIGPSNVVSGPVSCP